MRKKPGDVIKAVQAVGILFFLLQRFTFITIYVFYVGLNSLML